MPSAPTTFRQRLASLLVSVLALLPVSGFAESLASVERQQLPPLATSAQPVLAVANQQPLALAESKAWALQANAWKPLDWNTPTAQIRSAFGDGTQALVLTSPRDASVDGVAELVLTDNRLRAQALPALPEALQDALGAVHERVVYVAGIDAASKPRVFVLDRAAARPVWQAKPTWPGGAPTSFVVQRGQLLVTTAGQGVAGDALWTWVEEKGWLSAHAVPGRVVSGAARAMGQAHVLYAVRDPADATSTAKLMTFQIITRAWAELPGELPAGGVATAGWRDGLLQLSRTPGSTELQAGTAQVKAGKLLLGWLDWLVLVVYLAAMIGIGLYFYLREKRKSTSDFFVGGRSIPFWAAGVSLYAANTSSISFIAIPAKSFETNWQYLTNNLIAVLGLVFVAIWIVPLLRRLNLMSVFSYLETRFHPAIRMLASALAIVMQIGSRMSVILFLPALAISTITGIDVVWSVFLMGGFTIIYTAMGGMKAVIWTDFVQVIVKMGGAIFAILFIIWHVKGGFGEFTSVAAAADKTKLFDFSFDLTKATVWGFIFLVLFEVVLTFPKDQVLMQRVLSTESAREAGRSVWAFALIMIPGGFVFYGIGTALYVYYMNHPERMNPLLPVDATFPLFIAAELPTGVTGLIIAGIFSAAMATLSGIMNSVATLISVDFYEKLAKNPTPKKSVLFAEVMTVVVGLIGIGIALVLARFDISSLFDLSIELAGLLGGGFAGAYTLGMFTRRANAPGVAIGIACSIALTFVAWSFKLVHPYFYLAISVLLCIVIGYLASLFFPPPKQSLQGLTIYRRDQIPAE
ncbi:sodium:solute symporter [Pseudoxanthomonas helianthi]|uniref:Sodium:solute symporter n=1 Tax=Pseudoxanthomonas helianthi TaxID=1453541 RepID=A0A940X5G1_9GAMM|nr:sodium:solute symporter [Pseudoxanthomonas helianthi]MBP3985271.1 sodium:solute symporter [Pseudoxanthomonas helianthi]